MKLINILLLLILSISLYSIDFNTYFSIDNFSFNDDNKILVTDYNVEYGEIVSQEITNGLYLDAGITKTGITDYSIFTDFRISNDLFGFNIGIFTNLLNGSNKLLTPGLNYGLDFIFPGLMIINLDLNNTIPNTSPLENGVNINNYAIKLGFYIGEAILSGNLASINNSKGNVLSSKSTLSTKYFLNLDLFNKYSMYRISVDMGWHVLNRKISSLVMEDSSLTGAVDSEFEAGTIYFNTKFTLLVTDFLSIDIGFNLNLLKLPLKGLSAFPDNTFNWGANLGFKVTL